MIALYWNLVRFPIQSIDKLLRIAAGLMPNIAIRRLGRQRSGQQFPTGAAIAAAVEEITFLA